MTILLKYWYILVLIGIICSIPAKAFASCTPIFGGGLTCSATTLAIQNQVLSPTSNHFAHDLGTTDTFGSNDLVTMQIVLTNTGNRPLQKIIVKDTFPAMLTFIDGPGLFNKSTNILTFTVGTLAAHHSQLFTLTGRVTSQNNFPLSNTSCSNNQVSALAASGIVVNDSSQFCVKKLTTTPATGPEAWGLVSLLPTGLLGIAIKKLSSSHRKY